MRNGVSLLMVLSFAVLSSSIFAAEGAHKDGYTVRGGKVLMMKDGRETPVTAEVTFGNGSRLGLDGFIITREGRRERFQDDRWISLDGDYVVVDATSDDFDGYYLDGGRVYVMRDNTPVLLTVDFTFGDGSRLSPDGTIVLRDGSRSRLSEGQRVSKEGKAVAGKHTAAAHAAVAPAAPSKPVDATHKVEEPAKSHQPEVKAPASERHEEKAEPKREEKAEPKREEKSEPSEKREEKK